MGVDGPLTMAAIVEQLRALGVERGITLVVHSSLRSLGYVVGGAPAVILALEEVLGEAGTLAMPTHTGDLTDPVGWAVPAVPVAWHSTIREMMPAFRPDLTPPRGMGILPECFRKQEGTLRSYHPFVSWAARGPHAGAITGDHALSMSSGESSPLGRLYDLGARVLLIGVSWDRNTSFHLAEYRCRFAERKRCTRAGPVLTEGGGSRWATYDDIYWYDADFMEIGAAFEATGRVHTGSIGQATCTFFEQRDAVDFAVQWMNDHRSLDR
jgi:aminoglycoside 3-N-acetyltransferase